LSCISWAQQSTVTPPSSLPLPSNLTFAPSTSFSHDGTITELVGGKRWTDLLSLAQRMVLKNPEDPNPYYWQGIANFQLRKPIPSVQAFRAAEKLGLDNPALHEALGLAYYDLNQFTLFEEQMKAASRQDPKDYAPAYYLGLYRLSIRSDVGGALEYFREAVRLNPSDWKSTYQEGYCLELSGNTAAARASYLQSIHLVEESRQRFGWPYQGMARLDANTSSANALQYAKKAIELEPDEPSHHFTLAKIYEQTGDFSAAIKEARIAASQEPNHAAVRYLLFRLYHKAGDVVSADAELKQFQTLNAVYGPE
jgi:Flp pilus assembly protein TadD